MTKVSFLKRVLILGTILVVFSVSGSALSCSVTTDTATVHCPAASSCEADIKANNSDRLGFSMAAEEIPETGETFLLNETVRDRKRVKFEINMKRNRDLPSTEEALSDAKSICPPGASLNLYPKTSFQEKELRDKTDCYVTKIEELEDYYIVWREGTTEGLLCTEKVTGQMITGGETHYAAPVGAFDIIGMAFSFFLPF